MILALKLILLYCLSYIVPKKKGLYLFGSLSDGSFSDNSKYLFISLAKGIWVSENQDTINHIRLKGLSACQKSMWLLLRAELIFVSDSPKEVGPSIYLPGNFDVIQLWHGSPIKKICYDLPNFTPRLISRVFTHLSYANYKLILAGDNYTAKILERAFNNKNVKVLGYPRNDVLVNTTLQGWSKFDYKRFEKYQQIFLYCPTFRDTQKEFVFSKEFCAKLQEYLDQENALFVVKKHRADKRSIVVENNFDRIVDLSTEIDDISELYCNVDLVITDYSSLIFDFVLTDKPIILYCFDLQEYFHNNRNFYYDFEQEILGPIVKTEDSLLESIKTRKMWFNEAAYQEQYHNFKTRFNLFSAGGACERVLNYLELPPIE